MENQSLQEKNVINDARNLFRLKKLKKFSFDTTVKDITQWAR